MKFIQRLIAVHKARKRRREAERELLRLLAKSDAEIRRTVRELGEAVRDCA